MPTDPLEEVIVRQPLPAVADQPASDAAAVAADPMLGRSDIERAEFDRETRRRDLHTKARQFSRHDDVAASKFGRMNRDEMLTAARVADVPNPHKFDDANLRVVLHYVERKRVERGELTLVPDTPTRPPAEPARPVPVAGIPRSRSNQWKVEKGGKVGMPGGLFNVPAGTIVDLSHGQAYLDNLIAHGLILKPYPEVPESRTCPECDTVWLVKDLETGEPNPEGCPLCFMRTGRANLVERCDQLEERLSLMFRWAMNQGAPPPDPAPQGTPYVTWDGGDLVPPDLTAPRQLAALTAWAVREGAPPPDANGTWQGEPHPAPLARPRASEPPPEVTSSPATAPAPATPAPEASAPVEPGDKGGDSKAATTGRRGAKAER